MNNCTFVPYIHTYRILIACTFFAWDMYLLHLSCGSMSECYTPWASALCSLMWLIVEFLVIPAHSSLLLPYNRVYMTMYGGKICASSSYTFVLCVCGFCSCLVHFESKTSILAWQPCLAMGTFHSQGDRSRQFVCVSLPWCQCDTIG
jgi:hypothetical protein